MIKKRHGTSWYLNHHVMEHWCYHHEVLPLELCDSIVSQHTQEEMLEGAVDGGEKKEHIRRSNITFLNSYDDGNKEIFERVGQAILNINFDYFRFDIDQIEALQFSEYSDQYQGFYGKHTDSMTQGPGVRKLSFSIQLTDEELYEGGDLLIHIKGEPDYAPRRKGTMTIFPSYVLHEVTPVTKGTRHSLVGWVWGAPFK